MDVFPATIRKLPLQLALERALGTGKAKTYEIADVSTRKVHCLALCAILNLVAATGALFERAQARAHHEQAAGLRYRRELLVPAIVSLYDLKLIGRKPYRLLAEELVIGIAPGRLGNVLG